MTSAPVRTLAAPRPPELPPPRRFPLVATVAPLVVSLVLFAVTRSAFTLVFAALGPVVAVASTVDAARERRRTRRREAARFESDAARVADAIDAAHLDERLSVAGAVRASELLEQSATILGRWRAPANDIVVRVGAGERPSALSYDPAGTASVATDRNVGATLAELGRRARVLADAPVVVALATGIGITGPPPLAAAVARALAVQLAASLNPRDWMIAVPPDAEEWLASLPHAVDTTAEPGEIRFTRGERKIRIMIGPVAMNLPQSLDEVLELSVNGSASMTEFVLRPDFLGREEATRAAEMLAGIAERAGLTATAGSGLPEAVDLLAIEGDHASPASLSAPVGVGSDGPVVLDLVTHGPHAIVGGTTGSGKSELLLSWVLGIAAARSPTDVTFLFVDFKGGASFGSLQGLPHSVGVITDLDAEQALRALASLAAELRHRERELAANGLRGVDEAAVAPFPRLVVVVDEYAALVETFPTLHSVFADIAARGRSLGVHLILCTQRPAGVVRDGILANCALRISLRVTSAVDSIAVLGADAAASLPARPLGRALVSVGGALPTQFQVALSDRADVERVIGRWSESSRPRVPWLPPLPSHLPIEVLVSRGSFGDPTDRILFALADLPAEQAQRPVTYRPREHGSLLVVGAARSGKSGVLAALAAVPSGVEVLRVPPDLPSLWDFVTMALTGTEGREMVVLLDDLDSALAGCHEAYQAALVERLARLLRDGPAGGLTCVLTAQRVGGSLHGLAALCGSQLMLRMPNRAEHALAGGEAGEYVAHLPPGAGHWRGSRIQVAMAAESVPAPAALRSVAVDPRVAHIAVVSTRPEQCTATLRELAPSRRIVLLGPVGFGDQPEGLEVSRGDTPPILIADPDLWQSQWTLLGTLQRRDILFDGCSLADVRALTRSRDLPPPFPAGTRPLWLRSPDGEVSRATLVGD